MTLALCMIVKNEESVLARCLESVKGVFDEINIVDTGSSDATKKIAAVYTDRIYDYKWNDHFADARNASFEKATADYVMWLDADDVLSASSKKKLIDLKNAPDFGDTDAYYLRYDAAFDENGNPLLSFYRERIVRRACNFRWEGAIHETISVHGKIKKSDVSVSHLKGSVKERGRNLKIFIRQFAKGMTPNDRQKFYFARELTDNGLYDTACSAYEYFLQGNGCIEDKISACRDLAYCHRFCGRNENRLFWLFKSFEFGEPKPEICCDIGDVFREHGNYEQAIFWYRLAINEGKKDRCGGFLYPDASGYIPYMNLCVCYDRLGNYEKANACNESAGIYKPNDKNYLYNKRYFENILHGRKL